MRVGTFALPLLKNQCLDAYKNGPKEKGNLYEENRGDIFRLTDILQRKEGMRSSAQVVRGWPKTDACAGQQESR